MMHGMQEATPTIGLRASKKEATSRALSSAARSLALEHGLDDVTIDMICASAGVSTRTFFNYFESKGDAMVGERMPLGDERSREIFLAGGPSGELLADIMTLVDPSSILVSERRDDLRTALALVKAEPRVLALHLTRGAEMELELAGLIAARQGLAEPDFVCTTTAALAQTVLRCALFEWFRADADGAPGPYLQQATVALLTLARPSPNS
jgi:AcrR family transcriptional regulator